ncbi:MAG: GNAT family N-acetyltransferase [Cellulomonadaceae bacterium]|jgi:GNAT superfamily N-acetyltransferase|nr:GNAT family N-acetyltransferase [Cellulomonadaceae bacterium]
MTYEIVDLTNEQAAEIDERLEAFDAEFLGEEREGDIHVGIEMDGRLVAGAVACVTAFTIVYVSTVFVDSETRGQGIGTRLMEEVERRAIALGATLIRLDTFDWQGVGFYETCGYEQVGCYQANGFAEHFYLKRLTA